MEHVSSGTFTNIFNVVFNIHVFEGWVFRDISYAHQVLAYLVSGISRLTGNRSQYSRECKGLSVIVLILVNLD